MPGDRSGETCTCVGLSGAVMPAIAWSTMIGVYSGRPRNPEDAFFVAGFSICASAIFKKLIN
jgi:hypothetical protein